MNSLKLYAFFILVFMLFSSSYICAQTSIELVESVPLETSLDMPDIRNTADVWLDLIRSANKSIDIEIFYLSHEPGEPGVAGKALGHAK